MFLSYIKNLWNSQSIVPASWVRKIISFLQTHKIGLVVLIIVFFLIKTELGRMLCFEMLWNLLYIIPQIVFIMNNPGFLKIVAHAIVNEFTLQLLIEYFDSDVFFFLSFVALALMIIHLCLKFKKL